MPVARRMARCAMARRVVGMSRQSVKREVSSFEAVSDIRRDRRRIGTDADCVPARPSLVFQAAREGRRRRWRIPSGGLGGGAEGVFVALNAGAQIIDLRKI